jgi:hypothetical protein
VTAVAAIRAVGLRHSGQIGLQHEVLARLDEVHCRHPAARLAATVAMVGVSKNEASRRFMSPWSVSISRTGSQRTSAILESFPPEVPAEQGVPGSPE